MVLVEVLAKRRLVALQKRLGKERLQFTDRCHLVVSDFFGVAVVRRILSLCFTSSTLEAEVPRTRKQPRVSCRRPCL